MPLYEYRCIKCANITAVERSISEDETIPACQSCGAPTRRTYASPPVTFKGNGWGKDN
jgi:putative FmdB family regulatory protein